MVTASTTHPLHPTVLVLLLFLHFSFSLSPPARPPLSLSWSFVSVSPGFALDFSHLFPSLDTVVSLGLLPPFQSTLSILTLSCGGGSLEARG